MGGLLLILFISFLVLKITGVVAWSLWWVFSPLIALIALALVGALSD